jgi:hypothetical protein
MTAVRDVPVLGLLEGDIVLVEALVEQPEDEPIVVYRVFARGLPDDLAAGCLLHIIGRGDVSMTDPEKKPALLDVLRRMEGKGITPRRDGAVTAPKRSRRPVKRVKSAVIGCIGAG